MRAVPLVAVLGLLGSGCYLGGARHHRRNATIVNASLVFVGAISVLHEPDAMGRLPTSALDGDGMADSTRVLAGAMAIAAGAIGIVMNVPEPRPDPLPALPTLESGAPLPSGK